MSTTAPQVRPSWEQLGRHLLDTGVMSPDWASTFAAWPRSELLPDTIWPFDPDTGRSLGVSKTADPEAWYRHADANVPLVTQWDDGSHDGLEPGTVPTSSASMPSVVMSMLRDLNPQPGMDTLEIGTGPGVTAMLLAARFGDAHTVTVEVDPALAADARTALDRLGLHPEMVCADGLLGHPPRAPYHRLIVTCGLRTISRAMLEQTAPAGIIVAPWGTDYSPQDAVARLIVADDGKTATGRFTGPVQFMKARTHRLTWPQHNDYVPADWQTSADTDTTRLGPDDVAGGAYAPGEYVIGLLVPHVAQACHDQGDGTRTVWLYSLNSDRSWAVAAWRDNEPPVVYQAGARRLWYEVEAAWHWWDSQGRPGYDRFGLTVGLEGEHRIWLDTPEQPAPNSGA